MASVDVLNTAIGGAFAAKLDDLALALLLSSTAGISEGSSSGTSTWAGILANVGNALAEDQEIPVAMISNVLDYIARGGETASSAGSWMGPPPVLANMLDLYTSTAPQRCPYDPSVIAMKPGESRVVIVMR